MNPISKKGILDTLRTLDVAPGDLVFCHTSLRSFGAPLENGAKGLIEALLEAVSPGGAVAAPTHGRPPSDGPFDPATAPMWDAMGGFPRALLAWPGARRSLHPTHSDVAAGDRAAWLIEGHETSGAVGEKSPLQKIAREPRGKILLFGVDYTTLTLIHLAEWLAKVPYFGKAWGGAFPPFADVKQSDGSLLRVELPDVPGCSRAFNAVEPFLLEAGAVTEVRLRDCRIRAVAAGAAIEALVPVLRRQPGLTLEPPGADCPFCARAREILAAAR